MPYPKEVYKDGGYLVIWSDEEFAAKKRLGYSEYADNTIASPPPPPEPPKRRTYPAEVYQNGRSQVVFSDEERAARLRDGWSDEAPAPIEFFDPPAKAPDAPAPLAKAVYELDPEMPSFGPPAKRARFTAASAAPKEE